MELNSFLFYVLAALTGASAIGVVVTQNIVRAAAWLLFALAGTAGIFFLLGADFVGATQLLVYVGGTLVLVVFGVMLTAQGPFINLRVSAIEWAASAGVGLVLFGVLAFAVAPGSPSAAWPAAPLPYFTAEDTKRPLTPSVVLGESLLGIETATPWWRKRTDVDPPPPRGATGEKSNLIPITLPGVDRSRQRMSYLLPFEIVSVHLLVVLIGAAYLARAKRRRTQPEDLS
jgi:NADH-quinone oxidoreductase subunit J